MNVEDYRNEVTARLVKLDERQVSIFKSLQRIDKHLEALNGKVATHDTTITQIKMFGSLAVFLVPIVVTVIMRFL
tara:strand:+ start:429 stop:653 length:225 start_codon:yes stop_codon:yes gene_type:complete